MFLLSVEGFNDWLKSGEVVETNFFKKYKIADPEVPSYYDLTRWFFKMMKNLSGDDMEEACNIMNTWCFSNVHSLKTHVKFDEWRSNDTLQNVIEKNLDIVITIYREAQNPTSDFGKKLKVKMTTKAYGL
jgi:hypothetical protein